MAYTLANSAKNVVLIQSNMLDISLLNLAEIFKMLLCTEITN